VFSLGDHGSTYGGNPLTCAVGYAVVKHIVDQDVAGNARQMGQRLLSGLEALKSKFDFVAEARAVGCWWPWSLREIWLTGCCRTV